MLDRVQETWGTHRLVSFLFSIFAGLALVLATIGLYGLLAYTTLKRVREIGIRLALGARPAQIRALVLSHGLHLLLIGSAIGLVAAFALSRALQNCAFRSQRHRSKNLFRRRRASFRRNIFCFVDSRAPCLTRRPHRRFSRRMKP